MDLKLFQNPDPMPKSLQIKNLNFQFCSGTQSRISSFWYTKYGLCQNRRALWVSGAWALSGTCAIGAHIASISEIPMWKGQIPSECPMIKGFGAQQPQRERKTQRERKLSQWSTDWVEQLPLDWWALGLLLYSLCSSFLLLLHCPPGREQTLYVERLPFAVYMFPLKFKSFGVALSILWSYYDGKYFLAWNLS